MGGARTNCEPAHKKQFSLKIESCRNWFEKKDRVMIQQWKCTEFSCVFLNIFFVFWRSFFQGKVPEKSFLSRLHRKAAAAAAAAAAADMIWYHMIWYHMIWYHIIWYHKISYDIIWYHMISYEIIWCHIICYDIIWYHIIWYHVVWYDIIWYHMISCYMIWYHIWYDIIWYHMIWYHMIWYHMIWYVMIWCYMTCYDKLRYTFWTCSGHVPEKFGGLKIKFFQKVSGAFGLCFGIIPGV